MTVTITREDGSWRYFIDGVEWNPTQPATFLDGRADLTAGIFAITPLNANRKTISVDGEVCSIGSANIDIRSFSINYELNAVFYDPHLAGRLERDFERDLAQCTEFDPAEYRRRNVATRFRDSMARLVSPLL